MTCSLQSKLGFKKYEEKKKEGKKKKIYFDINVFFVTLSIIASSDSIPNWNTVVKNCKILFTACLYFVGYYLRIHECAELSSCKNTNTKRVNAD